MKKKAPQLDRAKKDVWDLVRDKLKEKGLDLENLCCDETAGPGVKVVCLAPGLEESFQEMGKYPRGQTVMIRTDEDTSRALDAWVETGHFKSRSEAASLFLREGLKLRASELEKLTDALEQVKKAKERLHDKAGALFGKKKPAE
jgi:Arc/MetJ-type ribon-helix-helix transcriptional regulator